MSFTQRAARHLLTIKAAKEIKKEIEKAGTDNLKVLAEKGISIVGTYLQALSSKEKEEYRRNFNNLLAMGITPEMILDELSGQMPEISPIMKGKDEYRKAELQNVREFLKQS
jgi:uncharacterized protein YutE (UPF0331/DUF86 family)